MYPLQQLDERRFGRTSNEPTFSRQILGTEASFVSQKITSVSRRGLDGSMGFARRNGPSLARSGGVAQRADPASQSIVVL
jgi:hypothetical protein